MCMRGACQQKIGGGHAEFCGTARNPSLNINPARIVIGLRKLIRSEVERIQEFGLRFLDGDAAEASR